VVIIFAVLDREKSFSFPNSLLVVVKNSLKKAEISALDSVRVYPPRTESEKKMGKSHSD
jgi:hypothetical protein